MFIGIIVLNYIFRKCMIVNLFYFTNEILKLAAKTEKTTLQIRQITRTTEHIIT